MQAISSQKNQYKPNQRHSTKVMSWQIKYLVHFKIKKLILVIFETPKELNGLMAATRNGFIRFINVLTKHSKNF